MDRGSNTRGTGGERQQHQRDWWTEVTILQSKLHGARGNLKRMAKFVATTGLPVQSAEANAKVKQLLPPDSSFSD